MALGPKRARLSPGPAAAAATTTTAAASAHGAGSHGGSSSGGSGGTDVNGRVLANRWLLPGRTSGGRRTLPRLGNCNRRPPGRSTGGE